MAYTIFRPKRGTAAQWNSANPILKEGEMGIEFPDAGVGTGACRIKFGDGSTPWKDLSYGVAPENYFGGDTDLFIKKTEFTYTNDDITHMKNSVNGNTLAIGQLNEWKTNASNTMEELAGDIENGTVNDSSKLDGLDSSYYKAFLYKAPLTIYGWTGSGPYVQTVNLVKNNPNAPDVTSNSVFVSGPMGQKATTQTTNQNRLKALNTINLGYATLGSNSVTVTCFTKPTADINVFWLIKEVG